MPSESAGFVVINLPQMNLLYWLRVAYLFGILNALTNNFPGLCMICGYILSSMSLKNLSVINSVEGKS